jgi:signal transduction histidine kinase
MNLIDNAIKYTKEGGTVHISLQSDDRRLTFKVKDTGIGIPPEKLARLFERFYRVQQRGTERIKGTGLGLFIVKHIAQRHGGDVTVETEPGVGSTFTLWLPMEGANIPGAAPQA